MASTPETRPAFFWSPVDAELAFEHHTLFLKGGKLLPDEMAQLNQLAQMSRASWSRAAHSPGVRARRLVRDLYVEITSRSRAWTRRLGDR